VQPHLSVNLLLARSHQAEIIILKHLIQGRNQDTTTCATRLEVGPRSHNQFMITRLPSKRR